MAGLELDQLDLVVKDMEATLAFYRAAGVVIPEESVWRTASGAHHVDVKMPGGFDLAFDSAAMARAYNRGWREPSGTGMRSVLGFRVASREEVDRIHEKLTSLGHRSLQPPYDAFWGSRYAIVEDPDGHHVGFMSAPDSARRRAPPEL
jgi:uncharacterized glyoxalase superfamily protein PhnB